MRRSSSRAIDLPGGVVVAGMFPSSASIEVAWALAWVCGAAAAERALAVDDARAELVLERAGDDLRVRGEAAAPGLHDELERGLLEAVLEVGPRQATAVGAQQLVPLRARHLGDELLRRLACPPAPLAMETPQGGSGPRRRRAGRAGPRRRGPAPPP